MTGNSSEKDQYNHAGMLAFMGSIVIVLAFFIFIIATQGVDLKEGIQQEAAAAGTAAPAVVDITTIAEPWVSNADLVVHGKKLFAQNCAMCHGDTGKGDGAAGAALNPKPRNLVEGPWKKGGGYIGLFTVLTEGLAGTSMGAYKHMKPVDRWALVQFIDSITNAKVKEDATAVADFAKSAK